MWTADFSRPLFSPCKWERDDNIPYPESNGLQSVYSLHFVLSNCLMRLSKANVNIEINTVCWLSAFKITLHEGFKMVFVKKSGN